MIWCIKHLSMLSSWRTVILQLDLALPLLSLCLRYFQFIYCSCQFDDFKISLNSFNDCFDPITSSACTAEQEALAPPFQPWAWTFSQTEWIERPENTQFKSFRSWESVNKVVLLYVFGWQLVQSRSFIQGGFFNWPSPDNVSRLAPPINPSTGPPLNLLSMRITKHLDFFRSLGGASLGL